MHLKQQQITCSRLTSLLLDREACWLSDAWLQLAALGSNAGNCGGRGLSCRCWQMRRRKPRVAINLCAPQQFKAERRLSEQIVRWCACTYMSYTGTAATDAKQCMQTRPTLCYLLPPLYLPSTSCLYIILRSSIVTKSCRSDRTRHSGHTASSRAMAVSDDRPEKDDRHSTPQHDTTQHVDCPNREAAVWQQLNEACKWAAVWQQQQQH